MLDWGHSPVWSPFAGADRPRGHPVEPGAGRPARVSAPCLQPRPRCLLTRPEVRRGRSWSSKTRIFDERLRGKRFCKRRRLPTSPDETEPRFWARKCYFPLRYPEPPGPPSRAVKSNRAKAAKGRFVLDFWQRTFLSTPSIPTSALSDRVSCCGTKLDRPEDILCICLLFRYRKILFRLVKKCLFAWLLARLSMSEILFENRTKLITDPMI